MEKKKYKRFFESEHSEADKLAREIEGVALKHFPRSYIDAFFSDHLVPSIGINFALGKDKSQWVNTYFENDIVSLKAMIDGFNKDGSLESGKVRFESLTGGNPIAKPEPGSYLAYSRIKVPLSKKTAPPQGIIKHLDTYFGRLKKALQDNRDKLPDEHLALVNKNF